MNTNEKLEEIARLLAEVKAELAGQAKDPVKPTLKKDGTMFISSAYGTNKPVYSNGDKGRTA